MAEEAGRSRTPDLIVYATIAGAWIVALVRIAAFGVAAVAAVAAALACATVSAADRRSDLLGDKCTNGSVASGNRPLFERTPYRSRRRRSGQ